MIERDVLPAPYPRQMEDHFIRLSDELQLARGFADSRASWEGRRPVVRQKLFEALGLLGDPPGVFEHQVTGVLSRDGYRIEKVVYQSRPGFYVTAGLYLPEVDHPVPGIICPHGHWDNGRYAPEVQRRMVNLATRGYAVLSVDAVGYNDREAQQHRTRLGMLAGVITAGVQLHDNLYGVSYLCQRPEVDAARIGCTGASGGGNQTMYLSALDERIKAAAPVCSVELGECYMHKAYCTCELVPGLRQFADLVDVCGLVAPRALLLVHGMLDGGFRIDSARKAYLRIRQIYGSLGVPEKLQHFVSYDTHAYNKEMREAVYNWFDLQLKGLPGPYPLEPEEFQPETAEDLRCLPDGLPEDARTMVSLFQHRGRHSRFRRELEPGEWFREADRTRQELGALLGGWPDVTPLRTHRLESTTETIGEQPARVETLYFFSEPDVVVPGVLYSPQEAGPHEVRIRFGADGLKSVGEAAIAGDLAAGRGLLALDLRGMGQTRAANAQNSDWWAYLASVTLGRHLAGMRAWDLRRAADMLLARDEVASISLAADGTLFDSFVALLAAACDGRFASLELNVLLSGFRDNTDYGELNEPGQLSIVPRLLRVADVGGLLALVAPRPLTIARWVDGRGEPTEASPRTLAEASSAYQAFDAAGALRLP